ncbi:MAG: patatin-like phospholipase family protein [Thiotrichaceae bacterium]
MIKQIVVLGFLFILSGCSSIGLPPLNDPLRFQPDTNKKSLYQAKQAGNNIKKSDDLTLILTFSGGGTRAAAFSYGVMKELESIKNGHGARQTSLLDEVDLISSVSGGSFTSAYYGLYGKRIFSDFERLFLKRPVQSSLIKYLLFSPSNWIKLAPALYERSDLAADYYADTIFGKKRYRDMRRNGPRIVINATDLASGRGFSFTKNSFKRLCSNISSYPVGRAVVASSAVPVVFSPIVMKNYSGQCEVETSVAPLKTGRRYQSFLHLVDGGVVDNLGIRSLINLVEENDNDFWTLMKTHKMTKNHKVVFIVVNASDAIPPTIGSNRRSPGTSTTLGAVTTIQSRRYNRETLSLLRSRFPIWEASVRKGRCAETKSSRCAEIKFQMTELNFNQLSAKQANELSLLETSLELPDDKVDQLIEAGRQLLRQSSVIKQIAR